MKKFKKRTYLTEDQKWFSFYKKWQIGLYVEKAGYFDERPVIHTTLTQLIVLIAIPLLSLFVSNWMLLITPFIFFGWGMLYIYLPIKTGIQDCESASWGINYHDNTLWIYIGGGGNFEGGKKWITFSMPWKLDWVRSSLLLKDKKKWAHATKGNNLSFYKEGWKNPNLVFIETHDYEYKLKSGEVQKIKATITVEEREWRPMWFKWTKLFSKIRKSINIEFHEEVGEETGSWKGGCTGCGYTLLDNETPLECLRRMENTRKF